MTAVLKFNNVNNNDNNEGKEENIVSLVTLANNLRFQPNRKRDIRKEDFMSIEWIPLEKLKISEDYQRLLIETFIRTAGKFDPTLFAPVDVSLRPNGTMMVVDGQNQSVIALLYTNQGGKLEVPCHVHVQPKHFTDKDCKIAEAEFFQKKQKSRTSLTAVDTFRAGIAAGIQKFLDQEQTLYDLGVCIENIGDRQGHSVYGYTKLFQSVTLYKLSNCLKAINQYDKNRKDKRFDKWSEEKDMQGALILGMSAVYSFMEKVLGQGDKCYALKTFMESNLGNMSIDGKDHLLYKTAGALQNIIVARRIIANCNTLITQKVLVKKNGENFQVTIGDELLETAGLGDPSKS